MISDRHYAPTEGSRQNLLAEGIPDDGITVTGNTCIDALYHVAERLRSDEELAARARENLPAPAAGRRLVLVTAHRRENFGPGFEDICRALAAIGARDDVEIVFPVHPNPNVQEPVLVMRDVTERPEAVAAGTVRLVGTDAERVVGETERLLKDGDAYAAMARAANPFGDGHASGGRTELVSLDQALAADVIVLLTDHEEFRRVDPGCLAGTRVIDTRGVWRQ